MRLAFCLRGLFIFYPSIDHRRDERKDATRSGRKEGRKRGKKMNRLEINDAETSHATSEEDSTRVSANYSTCRLSVGGLLTRARSSTSLGVALIHSISDAAGASVWAVAAETLPNTLAIGQSPPSPPLPPPETRDERDIYYTESNGQDGY